MAQLKWKRHLPKLPMALFGALSVYKLCLAYTGFLWVLLPMCPVIFLSMIQRNMNENSETQVAEMLLLRNGT